MTYREIAITRKTSVTSSDGAKNRHGFILGAILAAFEAYGTALCGHIAIDPAADASGDRARTKPVSPESSDECIETFMITPTQAAA
jgi:hypothetical protein